MEPTREELKTRLVEARRMIVAILLAAGDTIVTQQLLEDIDERFVLHRDDLPEINGIRFRVTVEPKHPQSP